MRPTHPVITILIATQLLAGCGKPLFHAPPEPVRHSVMPSPPTSAAEIQSVSLHLTECFGSCPSYTYTFTRGGESLREGFAFAPFEACAKGTLPDSAFALLADRLLLSRFFQTDSVIGGWITDVPYLSVAATLRDGRSHIVIGVATPPELQLVRTTVDSLGATVDWKVRPDSAKHGGCVHLRR